MKSMRKIVFRMLLCIFFTLLCLSCAPQGNSFSAPTIGAGPPIIQPTKIDRKLPQTTPHLDFTNTFIYTNIQPSGNRAVEGSINLKTAAAIDIPLKSKPAWILGAELQDGSIWVAALENGQLEAYKINDFSYEKILLEIQSLPPAMPPALIVRDNDVEIFLPDPENQSPLSHAVGLSADKYAFIDRKNSLVIQTNGPETKTSVLHINALPDSRIVLTKSGSLVVLGDSTTVYPHAVLGDNLEAAAIYQISPTHPPEIEWKYTTEAGSVIEGISPIIADLNEDGQEEIIVTSSNINEGSKILVLSSTGNLLAESSSIGNGFRWLHQISVMESEAHGQNELVTIRTPHLGGVAQFFQMLDDELKLVAELPGVTSHRIGSHNLDMALSADLNSDGRMELLAPGQDFRTLAIIARDDLGIKIDWSISLDSALVSNIAPVKHKDGTLSIGVGLENNILRVWVNSD